MHKTIYFILITTIACNVQAMQKFFFYQSSAALPLQKRKIEEIDRQIAQLVLLKAAEESTLATLKEEDAQEEQKHYQALSEQSFEQLRTIFQNLYDNSKKPNSEEATAIHNRNVGAILNAFMTKATNDYEATLKYMDAAQKQAPFNLPLTAIAKEHACIVSKISQYIFEYYHMLGIQRRINCAAQFTFGHALIFLAIMDKVTRIVNNDAEFAKQEKALREIFEKLPWSGPEADIQWEKCINQIRREQ